ADVPGLLLDRQRLPEALARLGRRLLDQLGLDGDAVGLEYDSFRHDGCLLLPSMVAPALSPNSGGGEYGPLPRPLPQLWGRGVRGRRGIIRARLRAAGRRLAAGPRYGCASAPRRARCRRPPARRRG